VTDHHRRDVHVIHLGDHDPSGIDMTRDLDDRLKLFLTRHGAESVTVNRIALNSDQVEQYAPPPNPAKLTDSRAEGYIARHGLESWELDALAPTVIDALISATIEGLRDPDIWAADEAREEEGRRALEDVAARFRDETDAS
jgi:hypothetical protein